MSAGACEEEHRFQQHTSSELHANTTFALIVEGSGYNTLRLLEEVMSAGAIPVICVDYVILPFQDLLDWDEFSIHVPEHLLESVW